MKSHRLGRSVTFVTFITFSAITLTAAESLAQQLEAPESVAQVRHNNGARILLNDQLLPFASDFFPVEEGATIYFNRGFTDFSLFTNSNDLLWDVQVFPGDSFASFNLEDYFVNTEFSFTEVSTLPSGDGNVIAYGFDPEQPFPVILSALPSEPEPIPAPSAGWGMMIVVGIGLCFKARRQLVRAPA
jgi:hypothetical protein